MLKLVACSRVLKHAVTCRSSIRFCPPSSVTSQFINTASLRLYSTEPPKRHDLASADLFSRLIRRVSRFSKRVRIFLPHNVKVVRPSSKKEDADGLYFIIPLNPVRLEDVKVSVDKGTIFIEGNNSTDPRIKNVCWIDLPDIDLPVKMFKSSDIKAEVDPHGAVMLIIPKLKKQELVYNVNLIISDKRLPLEE
ncbi:heat shock 22 kDa protein, mitochondrial-like [Rutidosis leptorrhynchoides]|uniref:heat shock 22 kDa protein, mitochondrial-like n=1 Tax=Rutidosis leptorrhynchoides TaxID=125765 RepID=UPI003A99172A